MKFALIRSMHADHRDHGEATLQLHTGSTGAAMPSLGAWLSYGLGSSNPNLPSHVMISEHRPYSGAQIWDSNFLPSTHAGVHITPGANPIPYLKPSATKDLQDLELGLLQSLNQRHLDRNGGDPKLAGRMASFDTARGLRDLAPRALDLSRESEGDAGSLRCETR